MWPFQQSPMGSLFENLSFLQNYLYKLSKQKVPSPLKTKQNKTKPKELCADSGPWFKTMDCCYRYTIT